MARQSVVFALIFFAIVGIARAQGDAQMAQPKNPEEAFKLISEAAAKASPPGTTLPAMSMGPAAGNDIIGPTDGSASAAAAPVGGPVAAGTFPDAPAEGAKASGAATVEATFAGVVVSAVVGSFFF